MIRSELLLNNNLWFWTDASHRGIGSFYDGRFFPQFPQFISDLSLHINALEILSVTVSIKLWASVLSRQRILVHTDNKNTDLAINSDKSRVSFSQACLRELWLYAARYDFEICARHIARSQNALADCFSRWDLDTFPILTRTVLSLQQPKMVYGPSTHGPTPLRTSTNELVKDPESIRLCWKEHFSNLLNRNAQVDPRAVDELEQHLVRHELALPPTFDEVEKALRSLKSGKASGPDGIPAEVIKAGGSQLTEQLFLLIQRFWTEKQIPADLRDALIVTLFKKGDKSLCSNYRGISLLSAVGKLFAKILLNRLTPLAEEVLHESQCGFRPSRGTIDMIFALRQIQEKCREQRVPLYLTLIDLTKAFDSIHRDTLWQILAKYGCPGKLVKMIRLLHDDMTAAVLYNGKSSEPFSVDAGVKQGSVIAPTLFSLFMGAVLQLARPSLNDGVGIQYRIDVNIFNLRRLQAKTKVSFTTIVELQYADDSAVCSCSEDGMQSTVDAFALAFCRLGPLPSTSAKL